MVLIRHLLYLQSPRLHCSIADTYGYKVIEALSRISNRTGASTSRVQGMTQQQFLDKGSSESCMPFSILGAKVLRYFRSRERKFQGTKVPWNESSTHGTFAPGSESTWERKFQLPSETSWSGNQSSLNQSMPARGAH